MPLFTTVFAPPSAPSGLSVEADIDASVIRLTWDSSAIAQVDFFGFRVSRSVDAGITWELLTTLPLVNDVSFDDYAAPLNVPLTYRLTQSNIDFESDPSEASTSLESLQWQVVVPGDASLTFGIPKMRSARLTGIKVQDVFSPIGRRGKLVVGEVVQVEDGEISFLAMPDKLGIVTLLRRIQDKMEGWILLKATDGSIFEVQYGSMSRSFTAVGYQEISIPFTGVG
jgi:hypothetical protein